MKKLENQETSGEINSMEQRSRIVTKEEINDASSIKSANNLEGEE